MARTSLDELVRSGLIERMPLDRTLVEGWLVRSKEDLELSVRIHADGYATRAMSILYEAGFRICLGHLALAGYRIRSAVGHHRAAIEGAAAVIGADLENALRRLDRMRRFRNDALYGNAPTPGDADVRQAADDVERLVASIERALHP